MKIRVIPRDPDTTSENLSFFTNIEIEAKSLNNLVCFLATNPRLKENQDLRPVHHKNLFAKSKKKVTRTATTIPTHYLLNKR